MKCRIFFSDEQVQEAFMALKASRDPGDRRLAELLDKALDRVAADAFCGIQVPKKLIPKYTTGNTGRWIISGSII